MSYLKAVLSAASFLKREWNKQQRLALQNAVRFALPKHRASACLCHPLPASSVTVSATKSGGTRLGGLMVCDSFHICPVCHHKKMAEDRTTIAEMVGQHYAAGGFMIDAVFTVPHNSGEALSEVLGRLEQVWKSLRSKPIWRELTKGLGTIGCIRRLEVTLTNNGWHPHYHVSLLCDWRATTEIKGRNRHAALADAHALVAGRWAEAGKKAGIKVCLFAQAAVAIVDAVSAEKAVAYNAKNMGFGGKADSLTPMDLLRVIDQIGDPAAIVAAKRLFAEYAEAIRGKHVLSLLGTARDMKATAPKVKEAAERLGSISADGWGAVMAARLREEVAQVTTRERLAAIVLRAAIFGGYASIPTGWLTLTVETKTVIGVKSNPVMVGEEA